MGPVAQRVRVFAFIRDSIRSEAVLPRGIPFDREFISREEDNVSEHAEGLPSRSSSDDDRSLHDLGIGLAERLAEIESKIAAHPKRVDYELWNESGQFGLEIARDGKTWALFYLFKVTETIQPDPILRKSRDYPIEEWTQPPPRYVATRQRIHLRDASLQRKAEASRLISKFLTGMQQEHDTRKSNVLQALLALDEAGKRLVGDAKEGN